MVSESLTTLCPADTVSGRWVLAYLHSAVGSRNVSDEWYLVFKVPGGSLPSHFLFAEFFCEIPAFFQKNFLSWFQKAKKRPLHLFDRRNERKK